MKRDEGGEPRLPQGDLEDRSFGDLALGMTDVTITRSRAIKLAGAALAGSALTILWPAEADARRRRKKKRRRRRKAQVSPSTVPALTPGEPIVLTVTNPSDDKPLTISGVQVLDSGGSVIATQPLVGGPVTIQPGLTAPVTVSPVIDPQLAADADSLRLVDASGTPITVVDEDGVKVGDGNIDVA